jgi:hypothetical protein
MHSIIIPGLLRVTAGLAVAQLPVPPHPNGRLAHLRCWNRIAMDTSGLNSIARADAGIAQGRHVANYVFQHAIRGKR